MSNIRTITVSSRRGDQTVQTSYSDSEAIARLTVLVNDGKVCSSFARDLVAKSEKWGLSPKQTDWVHVLLVQAESGPVSRDVPRITMLGIRRLLDLAAENLQTPRVTIETASGALIKVNRSGATSKKPGMIYLSNGEDWGSDERVFYGSIDFDGVFSPTAKVTPEIGAAIEEFNADPQGRAIAYGKRTGNCCFCNLKLSDPRSTFVGYGETCAGNYGLPWGEKDESPTPFDDDPSGCDTPEASSVETTGSPLDASSRHGDIDVDSETNADDYVWRP